MRGERVLTVESSKERTLNIELNGERVMSSDGIITIGPKRSSVPTAYLVDKEGNVIYHLVSAWWLNILLAISVLMIVAILIVSFLAFYNGERINRIMSTPTVKEEIGQ